MTAAQAPTHRPTWLTVLTSTMLIYGGLTLIGALVTLREPRAVPVMALENVARASDQAETAQKMDALSDAIVARYRSAVRAGAIISIGVALLTLYAVAAIVSRDRNGRMLALVTGWTGIAYQLGSLPLGVKMARQTAAGGAPLLAQVLIASGKEPPEMTAAELTVKLHAMIIAPPFVAAGIGVVGCLALLVYFGGRRGRALYGLEQPRSGQR
jgi:hypothetical protein